MRLIKEVIGAFEGVTLEWVAKGIVNWLGLGHDPNGCQLPRFKDDKEPTAQVPKEKKEKGNAKVLVGYGDNGLLYDEPSSQKGTQDQDASIDIDGLTEREYGEMLSYTPILRNVQMAVKIKNRRKEFTLKEIAEQLGVSIQTVKHYSAALSKAKGDSP